MQTLCSCFYRFYLTQLVYFILLTMSTSSPDLSDTEAVDAFQEFFSSDAGKKLLFEAVAKYFSSAAGAALLDGTVLAKVAEASIGQLTSPPRHARSTTSSTTPLNLASALSSATKKRKTAKVDVKVEANDESEAILLDSDEEPEDDEVEDVSAGYTLKDAKIHVVPKQYHKWNFIEARSRGTHPRPWSLLKFDTIRDGPHDEKVETAKDQLKMIMTHWFDFALKHVGKKKDDLDDNTKMYVRARLLTALLARKRCNNKSEAGIKLLDYYESRYKDVLSPVVVKEVDYYCSVIRTYPDNK